MPRRPGLDRAVVGRAAAVMADERGLAALSLADLAAQLGVRPPSLYNHIPSLAALQRDLAVLGVQNSARGWRGQQSARRATLR